MKKIFFALAALLLAFVGCNTDKELEKPAENKAFKVVVNMDKPSFGDDTRAARTDWEDGDLVGIIFNNDFEHVFFLTYSKSTSTWESELYFYKEEIVGGETYHFYEEYKYDDGPTELHETKKAEYLSALGTGSLKAIYCSSGLYYFDPILNDGELVGTEYLSNASHDEDNLMGECVMTCEDGTYSVSDGVLTLNITMKPQVAQFTIRDLDIADNYTMVYGGTMTAYAGGSITPSGVELNPAGTPGDGATAWIHDNEHGISIYASPWQTIPEGYEDMVNGVGGLGFFAFVLSTENGRIGTRTFSEKSSLKNGGAVIMDGPYSDGAGSSEWM